MADQVPQVPSWIPEGGVSEEENRAAWGTWSDAIHKHALVLAHLRLAPTVRRRLEDLRDEALYWIDQEDHAEAIRATLQLEKEITEARLQPLAKRGERFAPGRKAAWHALLRPAFLSRPEVARKEDTLLALLRQLARRKVIAAYLDEEDPTCQRVRAIEGCVTGPHIHWLDGHKRLRTVSLDQVRRFARRVAASAP